MIARGVAIVVGVAILAAVTHVTVVSTGGYGTPHSFVAIAIAAGVGVGAVFVGMAWKNRRWAVAFGLLVSIVAGEAFGLSQTADRLVAGSDAKQAPLREYAQVHARAKADVDAAEKEVEKASTSARLRAAEVAKTKADQAVTDSAKEMGCRANCRELLQRAVDDAAREVAAARADLVAAKEAAERKLERTKQALRDMKAPVSSTPLADVTGVAPWAVDLGQALLGSIGANGLACFLLMFGAHGTHRQPETITLEPTEIRPKSVDAPRQPKLNVSRSVRDHAARFALDRLTPNGSGVDLVAIRDAYRAWSQAQRDRYSDAEIAKALADLFQEAGIPVAEQDGRLIALGVSLKTSSRAIAHL